MVDAASTPAAGDDPEQIAGQIEQTRSEMSETIDAIQEKLNPDAIKEQAVERAKEAVHDATIGKAQTMVSNVTESAKEAVSNVTESAKEMVSNVTGGGNRDTTSYSGYSTHQSSSGFVDVVRQNPIPAALIALGTGWLFMNRSDSQRGTQSQYYVPNRNYSGSYSGSGASGRYAGSGAEAGRHDRYGNPTHSGTTGYSGPRSPIFTEEYDQQQSGSSGGITETMRDAAGNVTEQVQHVGQSARETGSGFVDVVRQNPIPAALTAVGLSWLFMNRSDSQGGTQPYYYNPDRNYYAGSGGYGTESSQFNRYGGYSGTTGYQGPRSQIFTEEYDQQRSSDSSGGGVTETVRGAAGTVQETAGQVTEQAREQVQHVGHVAQTQADQMRYWYNRQLQQSPLTLGLVAIGIGAAAGMMLPETQRESQLMGERRDQLVDRAQEMAQETFQKVQSVAQDVTSTVQETIQDSAQEQGLMGSGSTGSSGSVGSSGSFGASGSIGTAGSSGLGSSSIGTTGSTGLSGSTGLTGSTGLSGSTGLTGTTDTTGSTGSTSTSDTSIS